MELGLKDKVALVTAASRGLGRAVAQELAQEGAKLVMCGRNGKALSEAATSIVRTTNAIVLAVPADVSVAEDVKQLVDAGNEKFGRIDILVTNAGGPPAGKFEQLTQEQWAEATRLPLYSAIALV